jgi:uncharacterized membrane protein YgcG
MKDQTNSKSKRYFSLLILVVIVSNFFMFTPAKAQVNVSVNISSQALWGPVGYDYVEYYYLPEADVFYYVPSGQFIYLSGGQYVFVNTLPVSYNINLFSTYIVVINEPKPYLQHNIYFTKYGHYKNSGRNHTSIRDSDDKKYFVVKGHSKHGSAGAKENNKNTGSDKGVKSNNTKSGGGGNQKQTGGQKSTGGASQGGGQKSGGGNHSGGAKGKK